MCLNWKPIYIKRPVDNMCPVLNFCQKKQLASIEAASVAVWCILTSINMVWPLLVGLRLYRGLPLPPSHDLDLARSSTEWLYSQMCEITEKSMIFFIEILSTATITKLEIEMSIENCNQLYRIRMNYQV